LTRVLLCLACLGTSALGQKSSQSQLRARQIVTLNEELSAAAATFHPPGRISALLSQRATLLSELIASDPTTALALSLPQDVSARLRPNAPSNTLETLGEWEGTAEATVEDDFLHRRGHTRWYLRSSEGRFEMFFANRPPSKPNVAIRVRGMKSASRLAVASIAGEVAADELQCTTTGVQNVAVLMFTMPSSPPFPAGFTPSYFQQLFFGPSTGQLATDSVNSVWQEASYAQTSAAGQVLGPFALSQDYDCNHTSDMQTAAISAVDALVDFTQFTRLALVFPVETCYVAGSDFAIGGLGTIGCQTMTSPSKGNFTASVSWLPIYPNQLTPIYLGIPVHELGHNLGLNHASTEDFGNVALGSPGDPGTLDEYGDPFSVMGDATSSWDAQAPYFGQFSAEHKGNILHWLASGSGYQEVTTGGTFTLAPFESASGLRALRVLREQASGAWLWLEYRQPIGDIDGSLLQDGGSNVFNGALIHYENPILDALHTYLLDFAPVAAPNNFYTGALVPGQSWSDPYSPLALVVNSASSSALSVTVSYNQPCTTFQSSSTIFSSDGGTGAINVSAGPSCAWTVSTDATWITFPGATTGQGNGTVSFTVSANSATDARIGYIMVQRQSQRISQDGLGGPTPISPADGATGVSLTPTLTWSSTGQEIYDIGIGTSLSAPWMYNTTATSFTLSTLSPGTTYFWRVMGQTGPVITYSATSSFTTLVAAPSAPVLSAPPNGATKVPATPTLSWNASSGATSYDVYFGTESSPPLATTTVGTAYSPGTLTAGTLYYWRVVAKNAGGSNSSGTWSFTSGNLPLPAEVGTYSSGLWRLDSDGSGTFGGGDRSFFLGWPGAIPVTGDWNGDGRTKAGVYSNGYWYLDYNGDGVWDGGVQDKLVAWGWAGATPVVGDWNGDGKTKIGVYSNGFWFLDYDGNYQWDGGVVDKQVGWGWAGVTPVVGDWNGDGKTKIGVYSNGFWFLDYDGNYVWDGGVVDKQVGWGWDGVTPIMGDWNGDGRTKIGVYAGGYWYVDHDGTYLYDPTKDIWQLGWAGTTPVMGDWNGDGRTKAGAFINGYWYLDYTGVGVFDSSGRVYAFGQAGDTPEVGRW
jgi:hypothetical protein